jgi:hypothetical protein
MPLVVEIQAIGKMQTRFWQKSKTSFNKQIINSKSTTLFLRQHRQTMAKTDAHKCNANCGWGPTLS